jgi:hypothetical protein
MTNGAKAMTGAGFELTLQSRQAPLSFRVTFSNRSQHSINLLDRFEPLPVFFSFAIVRADGTPVPVSGAGKIDPGPLGLGCISLRPGETYATDLELAPWLRAPLPPARYDVAVTYHNQYGEECFTGVVTSNTISVFVGV